MAWIESHDGLEDHPKLLSLADEMGWSRFEASGRLHVFWKWCLKFAITGDLHKFNDSVLGHSVGLNGDEAKRFVKAMTAEQSCWIDRGQGPNGESIFRVHDWPEFTRYYIKDSLFRRKPTLWAEVLAIYAVPLVREQSVNSPRTVGHTYLPTYLPTNQPSLPSADGKQEGEDPNVWPMKPSVVVLPPVDNVWPQRIEAIHAWYGDQMGFKAPPDMQEQRLWFDWFKAGYDEEQFKTAFRYLRGQIKQAKSGRNPGAITLRNMLRPEQFKEDLRLALAAKKPIAEQKAKEIEAKPMSPEVMASFSAELKRAREAIR